MRCAIRMPDPWWMERSEDLQCRSAFVPAPRSTDGKSSESAGFWCAARSGCVTSGEMSDPLRHARPAKQVTLCKWATHDVMGQAQGVRREVASCKVVRCAELANGARYGEVLLLGEMWFACRDLRCFFCACTELMRCLTPCGDLGIPGAKSPTSRAFHCAPPCGPRALRRPIVDCPGMLGFRSRRPSAHRR